MLAEVSVLNTKFTDKKRFTQQVKIHKIWRRISVFFVFEQLLGDPSKAKAKLGWNPRKTSFEDLVKIMVDHDMKKVRKLYLKSKIDE